MIQDITEFVGPLSDCGFFLIGEILESLEYDSEFSSLSEYGVLVLDEGFFGCDLREGIDDALFE